MATSPPLTPRERPLHEPPDHWQDQGGGETRQPDRKLAAAPAIALTAFPRREDQQRALEAGFDDYLAKPLRPAVLLRTVVAMAGHAAPSRSPARAGVCRQAV